MRKLQYPLTRTVTLHQTTDDNAVCGLPVFPEDSDERIPIVFNLSLNEFVRLASAIDVGCDIAYPEDSVRVWYSWVSGVMCASFCDQMAECFEDPSAELLGALLGLLGDNSLPSAGTPLPEEKQLEPLNPDASIGGICDYDKLWGACLYFTRSLNRLVVDFFDILEEGTEAIEYAENLLKLIPFIGPFLSQAVGMADQIMENVREAYESAYDEDVELQIACALFCAAQSECGISLQTAISVMNSGLSEPLDTEDILEFILAFTTGVWVLDEFVYAMFLLALFAIEQGQFFGLGTHKTLKNAMALGADQLAGDAWSEVCDECSEVWQHTFEFFEDAEGWTVAVSGQGELDTTQGWDSECSVYEDLNQERINIERAFTETHILSIAFEYDFQKGTYQEGSFVGLAVQTDTQLETLPFADMGNADNVWFTSYPNAPTENIRIFLRAHANTTACAGDAHLWKVVVRGTGTNPFL